MFKLAIIRERKVPPDHRTPLTPDQSLSFTQNNRNTSVIAEPSPVRCFRDEAYREKGIEVTTEIQDCNLLAGIKEVPVKQLIPGSTYIFFSHTHKGQIHNRPLLKAICEQKITLYDYELLTDEIGARLIGFGRYAGIVGTHYALIMTGKRNNSFNLETAGKLKRLKKLYEAYEGIQFPPFKLILTGKGNVAKGALEVLHKAGIEQTDKESFLRKDFKKPVFVQLGSEDMFEHKDGGYSRESFYNNPRDYKSIFSPFTRVADVMVNAIFWDPRGPSLFEKAETQKKDFRIRSIADISCDIEGSVPITLKNTTRGKPVTGYDPQTGREAEPYQENVIDIMSIGNLPDELAIDASIDFGEVFGNKILPAFNEEDNKMLERACIVRKGNLMPGYQYLQKLLSD